MDMRANIAFPLWLAVAAIVLAVDACSDNDESGASADSNSAADAHGADFVNEANAAEGSFEVNTDSDSYTDINIESGDAFYPDEDAEETADAYCGEPTGIENVLTNISPFGNRATISWETTRPAICHLLWEETPVDYIPQVIYETGAATNHAMTLGETKRILPGRNYDLYIACSETCPGWPLQIFSDIVRFETSELHLLVALSPKYSDNSEVDDALAVYSAAVAIEGWTADIEKLNETTNDHTYIKELLAERKHSSNTLAAILVGEDLPLDVTSLPTYYGYYGGGLWTKFIIPSINSFSDADGTGDTSHDNIGIAVSLIVPSPYTYGGSEHLVAETFLKFASERDRRDTAVDVFHDSTVSDEGLHPPDYPELNMLGDLTVDGTPTPVELDALEDGPLKLLAALGHGSPYVVQMNSYNIFYSTDLRDIDVPFAMVSGCHTFCWTGLERDGILETVPINNDHFGGQVLGSGPLRAIVTGIPNQSCEDEFCGGELPPYWTAPLDEWPNFISYSVPKLAEGKSLAEAIYGGNFFTQNVVVYGDITFRYNDR